MLAQFFDHEWHYLTICASWLIFFHHIVRWAFSDTPAEFRASLRKRQRRKRFRRRS